MEIATLKIAGMTCDNCVATLTDTFKALTGVERASVSLASKHASVTFDPTQINTVQLKEAVRDAGYEVLPAHGEEGNCCGSCGG